MKRRKKKTVTAWRDDWMCICIWLFQIVIMCVRDMCVCVFVVCVFMTSVEQLMCRSAVFVLMPSQIYARNIVCDHIFFSFHLVRVRFLNILIIIIKLKRSLFGRMQQNTFKRFDHARACSRAPVFRRHITAPVFVIMLTLWAPLWYTFTHTRCFHTHTHMWRIMVRIRLHTRHAIKPREHV